MSIFLSLVLGVVQGLTEFLPVSSSGHLVLAEKFFELTPDISFIVLLHLASLAAVIVYFRKDLFCLVLEFFRGAKKILLDREKTRSIYYSNTAFKLSLLLMVSTVATGIIAFSFNDFFESLFSSVTAVGISLILTGCIIILAELIGKGKRSPVQMNFWDALFIGAAQGVAVAPGLSRSGATISASLGLNLERKFAAKYSFLLSIPAILAAGLFELKDIAGLGAASGGLVNILAGSFAAFISGYIAIYLFIKLIERHSIRIFAYYCLILGTLAIFFSAR